MMNVVYDGTVDSLITYTPRWTRYGSGVMHRLCTSYGPGIGPGVTEVFVTLASERTPESPLGGRSKARIKFSVLGLRLAIIRI